MTPPSKKPGRLYANRSPKADSGKVNCSESQSDAGVIPERMRQPQGVTLKQLTLTVDEHVNRRFANFEVNTRRWASF